MITKEDAKRRILKLLQNRSLTDKNLEGILTLFEISVREDAWKKGFNAAEDVYINRELILMIDD